MSAIFGVDAAALPEDASATTVAEWDSVRHLQLMMAVEDEFGVEFAADELASLRSGAGLVDRLSRSR